MRKRGRERKRERERERGREREKDMKNMAALFLFFKEMTGALAPFSYLVAYKSVSQKNQRFIATVLG